jgi:hypothetical protein
MNDAARSQADEARRSVEEAYRGQLRLLRDPVDSFWHSRAAVVQAKSGEWTEADFPRILVASGADSVVVLDSRGASGDVQQSDNEHGECRPGSDPVGEMRRGHRFRSFYPLSATGGNCRLARPTAAKRRELPSCKKANKKRK